MVPGDLSATDAAIRVPFHPCMSLMISRFPDPGIPLLPNLQLIRPNHPEAGK